MRYRHEVYYNLHKHCLSIRNISSGTISNTPRHVDHMESVLMEDVTFAVQPSGRARVIREGRKNVHAFVRGTVLYFVVIDSFRIYSHWDQKISDLMTDPNMQKITYNPYKFDSFVDKNTLTPVKTADRVYVVGRDIYALGAK